MNRTVTLFVAIALVAAIGIWLGARAEHQFIARPGIASPPQDAAAALTPASGRFDETGVIVMDQGTNTYDVAYIAYATEKGIATKKLVFPATYMCQAGDLPCAGPIGNAVPVEAGEEVRVVGKVADDVVHVERIETRS